MLGSPTNAMPDPTGRDPVNVLDSVFMPVGVNTARVKREQGVSPLDGSAGRRRPSARIDAIPKRTGTFSVFKPSGLRPWATPLTIGSFVLMTGTGVLMFFDVVPGYVTVVHEWLSWLFVLGVLAHVLLHHRPFMRHLGTGWGRGSAVMFTVLLVASNLSFGQITAPQLKWPISEALIEARLSVLADLTRRNDAQLLRKLAAHGYQRSC
jgi:hypothetical protein